MKPDLKVKDTKQSRIEERTPRADFLFQDGTSSDLCEHFSTFFCKLNLHSADTSIMRTSRRGSEGVHLIEIVKYWLILSYN